jgi:LemA protein
MSLIPTLVILFVLAGVVMYLGMIYNGLIAMRNDIDKSWANIDVLLKQRHERETLQMLIEARSRYATAATLDQKVQASGTVSNSLGKVFAMAEKYPALQANTSFIELQKRISELENQIADRREFYNDSINVFNTRLQQLPDTYVATFFGIKPRPMFLVTAAEKAPVHVALNS